MDIAFFMRDPKGKRNPIQSTSASFDLSFLKGTPYENRRQPPYHIYETKTREAMETGRALGICPNRLWNLILGSPRRELDLVGLMTAIDNVPIKSKFAHEESVRVATTAAINPNVILPAASSKSHTACTSVFVILHLSIALESRLCTNASSDKIAQSAISPKLLDHLRTSGQFKTPDLRI